MTDAPKGRFTFRFAAVCFGLSAVFELFGLHGSVPLFGQVVAGAGALAYHAVYVVLFAWLAVGLWIGSRSGYYVLFVTSALYTVDRLQLVFVGDTLATMIRREFTGYEQILQQVSLDYLLRSLTIIVVVFILCWWGFVGYAYSRRAYFGLGPKPPADPPPPP